MLCTMYGYDNVTTIVLNLRQLSLEWIQNIFCKILFKFAAYFMLQEKKSLFLYKKGLFASFMNSLNEKNLLPHSEKQNYSTVGQFQ